MEIKVLASGSSGNAYRISDGTTSLLLDAGIPLKAIQVGCDFKVTQIKGCFVTHNHQDHSKAAKGLMKLGVDIYTSKGTIERVWAYDRVHPLKELQEITVGTFKVLPLTCSTTQDRGFPFSHQRETRAGLYFHRHLLQIPVPGLGPHNGRMQLRDARSIRAGYIPIELVPRLMKSHMSLEHFLDLRKRPEVKQIYLLHLSNNNSDEKRFKEEVQKLTGTEVYVC